MLNKKVDQLTLASVVGSEVRMARGKLTLDKGRKMTALYLKCTVNLANSSGGAVTLTDAQKRTLLDSFLLTFDVGDGGKFQKPYVALGLNKVRRMARKLGHSEIEGWTSTTTGLQNELADSATEQVVFYLPIPTGMWKALKGRFKNMLGIGPSQAELVSFALKLTNLTVLTGVVITGNTTFDIMPKTVPQKGDVLSVLPAVEDQTEARKFAEFTEGLPVSIAETSAVQASAATTNASLRIDGDVVYDQLPATESIIAHADAEELPTAGQTTDEETLLYYEPYVGDVDFPAFRTGKAKWTQDTKDIATANLQSLIVPILPAGQFTALLEYIAKNIREKDIKAVSYADVAGLKVPDHLRPYIPYVLFDRDDAEFELYAGIIAYADNKSAKLDIPVELQARAINTAAALESRGATKAAARIDRSLAVMAPGAVQSGRGFATHGSEILSATKGLLAR